jgi:PAS domain S-box-containing protein
MRDGKFDSYEMDKRYLRKDGTVVWGRLTVSGVRKSDGSLDYSVGIIEDITWRKQAEEELRKSEERFKSSLLRCPLPIMLFDDREQILAVSGSWLEASGYLGERLRSIADWTACACCDGQTEVLERLRWIISTEPEAQSVERKVLTKDGRERIWSFVTSALGTQSDGRRLFISVAQDVTERKAHEEQVHLLMREVNHRAKNMLSLVQAIARQTAVREREDFITRFTERIQALAANQDLLVRNEWRGVDVEDLVRVQLAPFADFVGARITVGGPKLRLNAAAAQAIGLALHELATNAGKYGALSVSGGHVDIGWRLDGGLHGGIGLDGEAQRRRRGRTRLRPRRPQVAAGLPGRQRAGLKLTATGTILHYHCCGRQGIEHGESMCWRAATLACDCFLSDCLQRTSASSRLSSRTPPLEGIALPGLFTLYRRLSVSAQ